jgi:hypothetical protein
MSVGLAAHVEQADALVIAQGVGAHTCLRRHLGDRKGLFLDGRCVHDTTLRLRARPKSRVGSRKPNEVRVVLVTG